MQTQYENFCKVLLILLYKQTSVCVTNEQPLLSNTYDQKWELLVHDKYGMVKKIFIRCC